MQLEFRDLLTNFGRSPK